MLTLQLAKSKVTAAFESNTVVLEHQFHAVAGGLAALATIGGEISPFGVAWAAASPPKLSLSAGLGAVIGYLFSPRAELNVQYMAAVLLMLTFKWAVNILPYKLVIPYYPLLGGVAVSITACLVHLSESVSPYNITLVLAQAIAAVGSGYIFQISQNAITKKTPARIEQISLGTMLVILSSGLCSVSIGSLSIGRVALILFTLAAAYCGGASGGAVAGCISALAISMLGQGHLVFAFAIGGLLAGVFSQIGRIPTAAIFSIVSVIGLQLIGSGEYVVGTIIESTIASVGFLLIPKSIYQRYSKILSPINVPTGVLGIATAKLTRTASALSEVAQLTTLVNKRIEGAKGEEIDKVYLSTADTVCRRCPNSPKCWQTGFNDTMSAFNKIMAIVKAGSTPKIDDLPQEFRDNCLRQEQLLDKLSTYMLSYISRQGVKQQLSSIRTVVTDQFQGMAMLIEAACDEINQISEQSSQLTVQVGEFFSTQGAPPLWHSCFTDTTGTISIMVKLPSHKVARVNLDKSATDLSELVGEELDTPILEHYEDYTLLTYNAKAAYELEFWAIQAAADNGRLCGDSYSHFQEGGMGCVILSDGMGVGGAAAVDATMTTSLLSRLISTGASFDAALQLVNGALLVKSGEERLATVDCCYTNLYTGTTDFYKAGAVPSFILRSGRVATVSSSSLPAGILGGVEFAKTTLNLSKGDVIVMISDGIADSGYEWIPSQLTSLADMSLEQICQGILSTAKLRRVSTHEDDMTVVAARLKAV